MLNNNPMMVYHAKNWYWIVQYATQAWSSAALDYVEFSNTEFLAWKALGGQPTKIPNTSELLQVMKHQVQPHIMAPGIRLTSNSSPELNGAYALDDKSLSMMTHRAMSIGPKRPLPGGGTTFNYHDLNGNPHAFTGPQFLAFVHACDTYIYNWEHALANCLNGNGRSFPSINISIG